MSSEVIQAEKYRPKFHFSPPANWMNDPNGLVYFKGEYHLFYQHHPHGTSWGPMHWGHAVSKDLITWEHLPIALASDELGMIFSGSAVVDWNDSTGFFDGEPGLVAIFTHHAHSPGGNSIEKQSIAFSSDKGRTWIKYEGNPVLTSDKHTDFRDPKVFWHKETEQWVMIVASGQTVCLYRSPNLKEWSFSSEFGQGMGSHDGVWECPDLFALPVDGEETALKWVMFVSIGNEPHVPEGSRTQYFTGRFDGLAFIPDQSSQMTRWIDYGKDNYAGVSWSDVSAKDGRRIYIGWMNNWKYAGETPTEGWRGAMTFPRVLTLETRNGDIALIQHPVNELESIRVPQIESEGNSSAKLSSICEGMELETYELVAEFKWTESVDSIGFKIRASGQEATVVGYSVKDESLFIDRTRSGNIDFHDDFSGRHQAKLQSSQQCVKFQLIVDRTSVEVFANDGILAMTDLIYPSSDSLGLSFFCDGGELLSYKIAIHKLG
ncbi:MULTISPECIES: glycoside hydrolase family 32 protein [Paenibacillus]|uniref:Glycoside hydrolase n=1 Tax=Paenibacillus borealis TaxID=160799 RepID=A0ABX3H3G3_PAEBO|nr:glycoside hydrolase family 32 protein [Paenibacillus borealis]OMD44519.1 glycoside hydrolase [Paenibacillus borealis]